MADLFHLMRFDEMATPLWQKSAIGIFKRIADLGCSSYAPNSL
jgi:hypothetical protein